MCVWWGGQNSGAWGTVLIGGGVDFSKFCPVLLFGPPPQLIRTGEY